MGNKDLKMNKRLSRNVEEVPVGVKRVKIEMLISGAGWNIGDVFEVVMSFGPNLFFYDNNKRSKKVSILDEGTTFKFRGKS